MRVFNTEKKKGIFHTFSFPSFVVKYCFLSFCPADFPRHGEWCFLDLLLPCFDLSVSDSFFSCSRHFDFKAVHQRRGNDLGFFGPKLRGRLLLSHKFQEQVLGNLVQGYTWHGCVGRKSEWPPHWLERDPVLHQWRKSCPSQPIKQCHLVDELVQGSKEPNRAAPGIGKPCTEGQQHWKFSRCFLMAELWLPIWYPVAWHEAGTELLIRLWNTFGLMEEY